MNFSSISGRSTIGRVLRWPLKLIPSAMPVFILQGRARGSRWIAGSSSHGCWLGSYELEKRKLFENMLQPGYVVYDIGAHVGYYTLIAATVVGSQGHVYAFEPWPPNQRFLREHLRLNHVKNVTLIEAAVAERPGMGYFFRGPSSSMGHLTSTGEMPIKTVQLDQLVDEGLIAAPDCIKIDVEGAELLVLSGAQSVLLSKHPVIFLATHSPAIHRQCLQRLVELGYTAIPINANDLEGTDEIMATSTKASGESLGVFRRSSR